MYDGLASGYRGYSRGRINYLNAIDSVVKDYIKPNVSIIDFGAADGVRIHNIICGVSVSLCDLFCCICGGCGNLARVNHNLLGVRNDGAEQAYSQQPMSNLSASHFLSLPVSQRLPGIRYVRLLSGKAACCSCLSDRRIPPEVIVLSRILNSACLRCL